MTRDLDTLLRDADPLRDRPADDDVLRAARARVDAERAGVVPLRRRHWPRRVALIAAAAAAITAVPLVLSALHDDPHGRQVLPAAIAAANGQIQCGSGYASAVHPQDTSVRLLPDALPNGWSYSKIFARDEVEYGWCVPPSLTALQVAPDGTVTARLAVTGPVPARMDQLKLHGHSAPDTVQGQPAKRYDLQSNTDVAVHHWIWNDDQGQLWQAEVDGLPLADAQQVLAVAATDGTQVVWNAAAAPGWRQVQLRGGPPYGVDPHRLIWYAEMTGGPMRTLTVTDAHEGRVPLWTNAGVGDQLATIGGHPAILGQVRGPAPAVSGETDVPAGTVTRPVAVEITPGTEAWTWSTPDELPAIERMLASLRQVAATDPRLKKYGTD